MKWLFIFLFFLPADITYKADTVYDFNEVVRIISIQSKQKKIENKTDSINAKLDSVLLFLDKHPQK